MHAPRTVFLYPGQGAVPETDPAALFAGHPEIAAEFAELAPDVGDLADFHQAAHMDDYTAQRGVYALTLAMGNALMRRGLTPDGTAGHSLGLYAAWAGAGGLDPQDGSRVVRHAYDAIAACPMEDDYAVVAVIGLSRAELEALLLTMDPPGWVSVVNNRRQHLVSLPRTRVSNFLDYCMAAGALRTMRLPFERACHVPPHQDATDSLRAMLDEMNLAPAQFPLYSSLRPEPLFDPAAIADVVAGQLSRPLDWLDTVYTLVQAGAERFICLDPTMVLARIVLWITRKVEVVGVTSSRDIDALIAAEMERP